MWPIIIARTLEGVHVYTLPGMVSVQALAGMVRVHAHWQAHVHTWLLAPYTPTFTPTHLHARMHSCTHTQASTHIHACTPTHTHACLPQRESHFIPRMASQPQPHTHDR